jgi:membrane protein
MKQKIKTDRMNTKEADSGSPAVFRVLKNRFLRYFHIIRGELSDEQLALRAMSLVYTTLLSIVPLLAVSFSVLKAFGVHTRFEILLYYFLEPLGEKGVDLSLKVIGLVENVNVGVLGSIGLMVLVYTVMSNIRKIESALNYIWNVKSTRNFEKRFSNYLSVLLVGPILVFSAVGITGSLMSTSVVRGILSMESLGPVIFAAGKLIPYILISAAFTFIYIFLPNTKVHLGAALVGGVFAGVAWKITGMIFASVIVSSAKYSAIYSGFSILIFSLIWLYWTWFILFIGAKVAYYRQHPELIHTGKESFAMSNKMKERLAMLIMFLIADHFHVGKGPWSLEPLSHKLRLPAVIVQEMLTMLEDKGLLTSTHDDPPSYLPAKDLEIIAIKEIMDVVRTSRTEESAPDGGISLPEVDEVLDKMESSFYGSVKGETLKDLIVERNR